MLKADHAGRADLPTTVPVTVPLTVPVTVAPTDAGAGAVVAERVLDRLAGRGELVLGCPAGRTPTSTYEAIGSLAADRDADLSALTIVMMDEYVVRRGVRPEWTDAGARFSCHRYAREHLLPALNRHVPPARRARDDAVHWPDPASPASYDDEIHELGGVDVFLLASGASDGHVAFNAPGTPLGTRTRVVELPVSTRRDNLATFAGSDRLDEVPALGVTVGLGTIVEAREAILVLVGEHKAHAFDRVARTVEFDDAWPATVIHRCSRPWVVADRAAAGSYDPVRRG